jgi:ubiquinone/menaquinone biosynthesis C-methylase UbiE
MNFYTKHILPRLLNTAMNTMAADSERSEIASQAHGETVEIGFGSGLNLPHYRSVTKLFAVDPSKELFAYAKERIDTAPFPVEYIPASAEKLPFDDASIDSVVSTWSLCSIPRADLAMQEVARISEARRFIYFY